MTRLLLSRSAPHEGVRMSGLHYDSLDDCPPGLRKLLEKQRGKEETPPSPPMAATPPLAGEAKGKRKYHNTPTERLLPSGECIKFDSKKEAAYYDSLMAMERAGQVRNVRLQYQFLLKSAYTDAHTGERFRAINYMADFVFERLEDGVWHTVVVDTKGGGRRGTATKEFAIKRKLLAEQGIIIETA